MAQQPFYIAYNDENGLPDNEVYDLHQDKKGFIWIAGNSGLSRYNGQRFVHYQSPEKRSSSLAEIQEDSFGHLWMHDFTDRIFCVEHDSLLNLKQYESGSGNFPTNYLDEKNKLWVVVNDRITCYQTSAQFSQTKLLKDIRQINYRSLFGYKRALYCTAENKILVVNQDFSLQTIPIRLHTNKDVLSGWSAFFERDGILHLFILREKAIYKLQNGVFVFEHTLNIKPDIIALRPIGKQYWVLTRSGAYCFNQSFSESLCYFPDVPVSDVIRDRDGSYWFATLTSGVLYVPVLDVSVYRTNKNLGGFTSIFNNGNELYLGGLDGGIYTIRQQQLVQLHKPEVNKEVSFIYQTKDGKQLFWGNTNLYCQYEKSSPRILASNPGTKQIAALGNNQFLFTSSDGLMLFSQSALTHQHVLYKQAEPLSGMGYFKAKLVSSRTSCFYYNADDTSVVAVTKTGVVWLNKHQKKPVRLNNEEIYGTTITGDRGQVWIGTLSSGLLQYNSGVVSSCNDINKRLVSQQIQKVAYAEGHLVVAHALGVQVFNLSNGQQYNYLKSDGLFGNKINSIALFQEHLYIAGNKGVLIVPLHKLLYAPVIPSLYLRSVNGQSLAEVVLKNTQRLHINYQLVAFRQKEYIKIRYRLDSDDQWNDAGFDQEQLVFNNLPFGTCKVFLQAYNELNGAASSVITVQADVIPPFWRTWWFLSLVLIFALAAFALLLRWRLRILASKNKELLEREKLNRELKSSMLASIKSQMNPHFIFNALNTIQSYVLQNERMQANFYLGKFSDLMRKILNMSTLDKVMLEEEIDALRLYLELENMRFNGALEYQILLPDDLLRFEIPSMIIQPYVENSIKHGLLHKQGVKLLTVKFTRVSGNLLQVVVFDNGIGRVAAAQIKSRQSGRQAPFSTEANQRRLELLNESLPDKIGLKTEDLYEGGQPSGTRVTLFIPLH